jgi:LPXTG-motif cell wall-anchored protein
VVANWNQPENSTRHFAMALGLFGLAGLTGWVFRRWRHARVQRP